MFSITLADGTVLDELTVNGSYYISKEIVDEAIFADNCSPMTITDGENEDVHDAAELVNYVEMPSGGCRFAFRDIPASELVIRKIQGDLDFLAMMTDVEL